MITLSKAITRFFTVAVLGTLHLCIVNAVFAQNNLNVLQIKVTDQDNKPLPDVVITIENSKPTTTDKSGRFKLLTDKKPSLPIQVKAIKDGYKLKLINYYEDEGIVEVQMDKSLADDHSSNGFVKVAQMDNSPLSGAVVVYEGQRYITDASGSVNIKSKIKPSKIVVEGKSIEKYDFNAQMNIVLVQVVDAKSTEQVEDERMQAYKIKIEGITEQIEADGKQLVKDLVDVQVEISDITSKLKEDQYLTPKRKQELKSYVDTLEMTLSRRRMAFQEASEKTSSLINILKQEIFNKDSLYNATKTELVKLQEEKKRYDEEYNRKLLVYGYILGVVALMSILSYFFILKLNNQKKQLEQANAELILQQELVQEKNKQLDTFVYRASHDIKGPLKSVIGLTNVGLMAIKDPEALNYFDHISKSTKKLLKTLDNLLLLTKAERTEIKLSDVNIASLMEQALSSFENSDGYKGMEFNLKIEKGMTLMSDETVLYSVFQNLIENGIKYHDPKKGQPYMDILAKREGNKAIIKFVDNGLGIDKKHHTKIFDMFYKINDGSSGTGLGLHIVKQLVEHLGGNIKLESEMGAGSTFILSFPLV